MAVLELQNSNFVVRTVSRKTANQETTLFRRAEEQSREQRGVVEFERVFGFDWIM